MDAHSPGICYKVGVHWAPTGIDILFFDSDVFAFSRWLVFPARTRSASIAFGHPQTHLWENPNPYTAGKAVDDLYRQINARIRSSLGH